jgi:PAS domain S-box-containing protein
MNTPDSSQEQFVDRTLHTIVEGTAGSTGEQFFHALVKQLASVLGVRYAFISEFTEKNDRVRTLAFWQGEGFRDNFEYDLVGTPCEQVLRGEICHFPKGVQGLFPDDHDLSHLQAESYLAVPLSDPHGEVLGHLAVLDEKPMPLKPYDLPIFKIFSARAGAELERKRAEIELIERKNLAELGYEISMAVTQGLTLQETLQQCAQILVQQLDFALVRIWTFNEEAIRLELQASAGLSTQLDGEYRSIPMGQSKIGRIAREKTPLLSNKVIGDPLVHDQDWAQREGMVSFAGYPLLVRNHLVGVMALFARHPLTEMCLQTLKTVSNEIALGIDRKRAETALRESEDKLARILECALDAIVTFDQSGNIVLFNSAAESMFGCPVAEALGASINQFLSPELRSMVTDYMTGKATDQLSPARWIPEGFNAVRREGQTIPIEASLSKSVTTRGTLFTIIVRDINERKRAEAEFSKLQTATGYLQEEINTVYNFEELIGSSLAMKTVFKSVDTVAPTDSIVLITGETGTGKELIARGIHNRSTRNEKILVKVNCSAIPRGLIESELFGHEKGSFTGAVSRRIGRFELADGGTIFLDEIGELPLDLQAKLLRVLQEGEFERVGGSKTFAVNVRVITATNRQLEDLMKAGQFRSDLFYRLHVFPVQLPPLRERKEDIPLLIHHFAKKFSSRFGKNTDEIPPSTITNLQNYAWPGNVRELEHVIERAVILSESSTLTLGEWFFKTNVSEESGALITLEEHERQYILQVLDHTGWKVSGDQGAAQILGIKPTTLESRMKKLGINRTT